MASSYTKIVPVFGLALLLFSSPAQAAQKDTSPPTQPGNPRAVSVSCSQINLSWDPSTDPSVNGQSASGVQGYYVYLQGNSNPLKFVGSTSTSVTGLSGNTGYSFQIAAVDYSNNVSTLSVAASATTPPCADSLAPSIPNGLTVAPLSCSEVSLSWQASTDPITPNQQASGVQGYNLYRSGVFLKFVAGTSTTDAGLFGGVTYGYEVSAVDVAGNQSARSASVPVTAPPCPPDPPTGLNGWAPNCKRIELSWSAPANTGSGLAAYNVYRDGNFVEQVQTESFSEAAPEAAASFSYWVTTIDTWGRESALSAGFAVAVPGCPAGPPSNLRIKRNADHLEVQWDGTAGALYQAQVSQGFFGPWLPVDGPTRDLAVTNLAVQPSAIYRVALFTNTPEYVANLAVNAGDRAAPNAPPNFNVIANSDTEALLTWDSASDVGTLDGYGNTFTSGVDRYLIYRDGLFLKSEPATATSSSDANVITDAQYTYSVATLDKAGNRSPTTSHSVLMRKQCSYSVSPGNASFNSGGGGSSFSVSAGNGCSWAAQTTYPWIHSSSSGNGGGMVTYSVDANTGSARSGTITVGTQTFTISQAGVSCSYSLAPTSFSHGAGTEGGSFGVTAGVGCTWSASSSYGWIHTSSSGNGSGSVSYTIDANTSVGSRSGTITAGGQVYTVYQAGVSCSYAFNPTGASYGSGAGSGSFAMSSPSGCSWLATTISGWIHTTSSGSGNGTISYTFDGNTSSSSRSGTITAGGQTFTINQAGVGCSYSLNATSGNYAAGATSGSFGVSCGAGCGWNASTAYGWIHTTSSGSGNGTVSFTIDANTSVSSRSGTVSVGGQNFTVNQAGVVCVYALVPTSANHSAAAESGGFSISVALGCGWTASSADSWIHTASSGSGNGTISYTVDANGGTSARSGTIIAGGQTFSITQAASCAYSLSSSSTSIGSTANSGTVGVTTGAGCSWTAASTVSWITVTSGGSGSGNGTVGYSVDANTGSSSRVGSITIAGQAFTVTQSGSGVVPGTYAWAKDLRGTTVTDTAHVNGVAVDHQGNTIAVGTFAGTINFGAGFTLTSAGGQDVFVARYNSAGVIQWAKRFGDAYDQAAYGVSVDSANNIIVVGGFAGTISFGGPLLSEVPTPSFYYSQTDIFVAKLNSSGGHVWSRSFGSSGAEVAYGVSVDGADNLILTGNYAIPPTTAQLDFGGGPLSNAGAQDMFVTKLSGSDGSYRWAVHHGNTDGTYSYAVYSTGICADRNGDVAVVGYFSGGTVDLGGGNRTTAGGSDIFVAKYSGATGGHLWSKTIGGPGSEVGKAVTTDPNNNVIITGGFNGTVDFGGATVSASQATGIFVAKYSGDGRQLVWVKGFGGNFYGQDIGYGIASDPSGNIGVTGTVQGSYVDFGGGPLYSDGTLNIFVTKLGADGSYVWGKRLKSGATLNYGCAAAFDGSGNLLSGGYFGGTIDFGGGPLTANISAEDGFLAKFGP